MSLVTVSQRLHVLGFATAVGCGVSLIQILGRHRCFRSLVFDGPHADNIPNSYSLGTFGH